MVTLHTFTEKYKNLLRHVGGFFSSQPVQGRKTEKKKKSLRHWGRIKDVIICSLLKYHSLLSWKCDLFEQLMRGDGDGAKFGVWIKCPDWRLGEACKTKYPQGVNASIPFVEKNPCSRMCCHSELAKPTPGCQHALQKQTRLNPYSDFKLF